MKTKNTKTTVQVTLRIKSLTKFVKALFSNEKFAKANEEETKDMDEGEKVEWLRGKLKDFGVKTSCKIFNAMAYITDAVVNAKGEAVYVGPDGKECKAGDDDATAKRENVMVQGQETLVTRIEKAAKNSKNGKGKQGLANAGYPASTVKGLEKFAEALAELETTARSCMTAAFKEEVQLPKIKAYFAKQGVAFPEADEKDEETAEEEETTTFAL